MVYKNWRDLDDGNIFRNPQESPTSDGKKEGFPCQISPGVCLDKGFFLILYDVK
jgi:hypothetical protein